MSSKKLVTRTFNSTSYTAMFVNTDTAEVETRFNSIAYNMVAKGGEIKENYVKELTKAINKQIADSPWKLVKLIAADPVFELRGMTEDEFFAHSKALPPRTTAEKDTDSEQ